jgi:nucleotide-binding universal stress UspA family protein
MNTSLLVGVDPDLSPTTRHMLRMIGHFLEGASLHLEVVVLTVIPVPIDPSSGSRWSTGLHTFSATSQQRVQAVQAIRRAMTILQQEGVARQQMKEMVRVGSPAEEMVRVAGERQVTCIVIGSHGESLAQRVRRGLMGSVSRHVLRLAPVFCSRGAHTLVCPSSSPRGLV